jgi:hypothetical protein
MPNNAHAHLHHEDAPRTAAIAASAAQDAAPDVAFRWAAFRLLGTSRTRAEPARSPLPKARLWTGRSSPGTNIPDGEQVVGAFGSINGGPLPPNMGNLGCCESRKRQKGPNVATENLPATPSKGAQTFKLKSTSDGQVAVHANAG